MIGFLRRRRAVGSSVSFCDSCGRVCTDQCRADAHYDQTRLAALSHALIR